MELYSGNGKRKKNGENAPKRQKKKSGSKWKIGVLVFAIILALLAAAACAGVVYVNGIDRIYPNVSLDGHDIGGMSVTELAAELGAMGYSSQEGKTVTVELPLDFTLEVRGEDVCSETPVADIAQAAYDACKGGSAVTDAVTYLKCLFGGMELKSESILSVDESAVRALVDNLVHEVNLALMGSDLEVGEDSIRVTKGARSISVDAEEITGLVVEAFRNKNYGTIVYEAEITADNELDLNGLYDTVYCEAADAYYDKETGEVVEHVVGMDFDVAEAQRLWDDASYGDEVVIPLILTEPELTTEEYEELLFRDCLSSKSTSLWGSSYNRVNNVTLAANACNEYVLLPGEEFSYNDVVGKRTAERGYLPAGAYSGGETVQEYGGGICQVSSTIYYCALHSNLQITNRVCHTFPVSYLPAGLDATVSWGGPEFKFVNDREYPIKIVAYVEENNLFVEIWGTDVDGSYVVVTNATELVYDDEYTDVAVGYKAQTWRNVYDKDGNLLSSKREAGSFYNYHEEDIEWPEESPEPTETPAPTPTPEATPTPEVTPPPEETPVPETTPEVTEGPAETPQSGETEPAPQPTPEPTPDVTEPVEG